MRIKSDFLERLAEAVAGNLNTDDIERAVVDQVDVDGVKDAAVEAIVGDIRTRDVEEAAAEAAADDVDASDVLEKVADALVDRLADDDDFKGEVASLLALRLVAALTEPEAVEAVRAEAVEAARPPVEIQTVPTTAPNLTGGAVACKLCGGSVFMHRGGRCPTTTPADEGIAAARREAAGA